MNFFSNTLNTVGRILIGLYFFMKVASAFFKMGVIDAGKGC